jgi:hypothetical protein
MKLYVMCHSLNCLCRSTNAQLILRYHGSSQDRIVFTANVHFVFTKHRNRSNSPNSESADCAVSANLVFLRYEAGPQ